MSNYATIRQEIAKEWYNLEYDIIATSTNYKEMNGLDLLDKGQGKKEK